MTSPKRNLDIDENSLLKDCVMKHQDAFEYMSFLYAFCLSHICLSVNMLNGNFSFVDSLQEFSGALILISVGVQIFTMVLNSAQV